MEGIILSLFDKSGIWGGQYEKAGYTVVYWDISNGGKDHCILERFPLHLQHYKVKGVIAMPPCTDFAASGARWWPYKDAKGSNTCYCCDSSTEHSMFLARAVLAIVDLVEPEWWVMENPVGRLERLMPEFKPYRQMTFQPCDYGAPFTKKTVLWGNFNTNLPKKPVFPLEGSRSYNLPSSAEKKKGLRSLTPKGFARAFYLANP